MATNYSLTEKPYAKKTVAGPACELFARLNRPERKGPIFMNVSNIYRTKEWFEVLQTTGQSQTAVMRLEPNQPTGKKAESHKRSQQLLLLIQGSLLAELDGENRTLQAGDVVIIPPGVKHKFINPGTKTAVTFNVYCPPEYPPDEKRLIRLFSEGRTKRLTVAWPDGRSEPRPTKKW
jgi:mannose-6-phosphate isomerase-like protein (cupin superfamily)